LLRQVRSSDRPLGVLARDGGEPVGWLALGPRPSFPRLVGSRSLLAAAGGDRDDAGVWSTTCFVVKVGRRRRGMSGALLAAGVELARAHGATVVEGYPVDLDAHERFPGSANLFHGAASVYRRAGFREVGRISPTRPIMRLDV